MRQGIIKYTDTTSKEAVADYMKEYKAIKTTEHERKEYGNYFLKQRAAGVVMLVIMLLFNI